MADAVVVPGMYGPATPLPTYTGDLAAHRGAAVHRLSWSAEPVDYRGPEVEAWVCDQVSPVLDQLGGGALLIGKSLGVNAARLAAQRSLPAVWLTPVLRFMPWVVEALEASSAPFLLVGGTADRGWDTDVARRLTPHVFTVDGADHGMCLPGPPRDSIEVLGRVVDAVEMFLDEIAWPS